MIFTVFLDFGEIRGGWGVRNSGGIPPPPRNSVGRRKVPQPCRFGGFGDLNNRLIRGGFLKFATDSLGGFPKMLQVAGFPVDFHMSRRLGGPVEGIGGL